LEGDTPDIEAAEALETNVEPPTLALAFVVDTGVNTAIGEAIVAAAAAGEL
jgi:hypothetical protein